MANIRVLLPRNKLLTVPVWAQLIGAQTYAGKEYIQERLNACMNARNFPTARLSDGTPDDRILSEPTWLRTIWLSSDDIHAWLPSQRYEPRYVDAKDLPGLLVLVPGDETPAAVDAQPVAPGDVLTDEDRRRLVAAEKAMRKRVERGFGKKHADMAKARADCIRWASDCWSTDQSVRMGAVLDQCRERLLRDIHNYPSLTCHDVPEAPAIRTWFRNANKTGELIIPESASRHGLIRKSTGR